MKILDLQQGTDEWKDYRRYSIGATDFAVIAANKGYSNNLFHKSINKLIKDKITPPIFRSNKYFEMGHNFEDYLLNKLNAIDLIRSEVIEYHNRVYASLDARDNFINQVIEIKSTSKSLDKFDELINYYQYQVLHQCYCAGSTSGKIYIGFLDNRGELLILKEKLIYPYELLSKDKWIKYCHEFLLELDKHHINNIF